MVRWQVLVCLFMTGCSNSDTLDGVTPGSVETVLTAMSDKWAKKDIRRSVKVVKVDPSIWNQAATYIGLLSEGVVIPVSSPMSMLANSAYSSEIQFDHLIFLFRATDGTFRYIFQENLSVTNSDQITEGIAAFHAQKNFGSQWSINTLEVAQFRYRGEALRDPPLVSEEEILQALVRAQADNIIATRIVCATGRSSAIQITNEYQFYIPP